MSIWSKSDLKTVNVAKGSGDNFEKKRKKNEKFWGGVRGCCEIDENQLGFSLFC